MHLDPLQRLVVDRQMLNPKPRNWRLVAGLAVLITIAVAMLVVFRMYR